MARYLVVANITAESPSLRTEVARIAQEAPDTEFVVLVPLRPIPVVLELVGAVEERPVALGRRRAQRAVRRLESVGVRCATVRLGGYDPLQSIEEELAYQEYRGVIISTLPHPVSHWLRTDLPSKVAKRHPELDVRHVVAPRALYVDEVALQAAPQLRYD
jgi:hypothetical protein